MLYAKQRTEMPEQLMLLVYELLDAHADTERLAADLTLDWRWQVHLGYLRDLQCLGREALASGAGDMPPACVPSREMTYRGGDAWQLRSNAPRRGPRRCARHGHDERPS
jgi:hypothetical protein